MTDDATLLRRYAEEKSEDAFAEFVRRHLPLVYGAAVRRLEGDAHRAKDIAQVVFCAAARDAKKLARHAVLTGWLYTTTRNAVVDTQRAESRRRTREAEAHALQVVSIDSAAGLEWTRVQPVLDAALDELAADDREAVLLRFFQSRTFAEVGAALGASEEAARKRVDRALDKLRDRLDRRGISSTSAALAVALAGQAAAAVPAGLVASVTSAAVAAGGAALGAATIFGLTKFHAGLTVAIVTAGAGGVVWQQQSVARLRDDLARRDERIAALIAENAQLTLVRVTAQAEADRLRAEQTAPTQTRTEAAAGVVVGPAGAARPAGGTNRVTAASDSPLLSAAATHGSIEVPEVKRAAWHRRYDPFFHQQGFTPARVERIMELWFLQEQARLDLQTAVAEKGLRGDAPGVETLRSKLYAPITAELRTIMGDKSYAAYGRYEGDSYFRMIVTDSLSARFSRAQLSLSPEQTDRLADLVRIHRRTVREKPTDIGTSTHVDWRTVADNAGDILAPAQLAILREFAAGQPAAR